MARLMVAADPPLKYNLTLYDKLLWRRSEKISSAADS